MSGSLVLALATAACTSRPESTVTPPSVVPSPSVPAISSHATPKYEAGTVGLCAKTDLAPLVDLSLKVVRKDPTPPTSGPGEACLFEMTTPDGHIASLRVEAVALASAGDAERLYRAERAVTRMISDGSVAGVGEQAEAFAIQSEPGFKYAEYKIHVRDANLVLEVWLAVGGNVFTPKATLAAATRAVVDSAFATVSRAWVARS